MNEDERLDNLYLSHQCKVCANRTWKALVFTNGSIRITCVICGHVENYANGDTD